VLPTRLGRTGLAFGAETRLNLRKPTFARDPAPIDDGCDCLTCGRYSRAQLHGLSRQSSALGARLISLHNTRALVRTADGARRAILAGRFGDFLANRAMRRSAAGQRGKQPAAAGPAPMPAAAEGMARL
jgi:queuine tRNA-ribosyltransferase